MKRVQMTFDITTSLSDAEVERRIRDMLFDQFWHCDILTLKIKEIIGTEKE